MVCRRCGHPLEPDARFCSRCGAAVHGDEATVSMPLAGAPGEQASTAEIPIGAALLRVVRGPNAGSVFALASTGTSLGRHPESDVFLDDITVSRRHAVIERDDDEWRVRDAGSLNGTYVNGERIETAPLAEGDEIQVGRYLLSFHAGS